MPPIQPPEHQMDTRPLTWSEVANTVKRARSASAPGPNGVPYRLYKNTPGILKYLWKLMKVAWRKESIPKAWRRAGGILIPKEKNSSTINQFRQISLLNLEGKIFFSVVAQRLSAFLQKNNFIDTSVQKAGRSGFSGCLEHANIIWPQPGATARLDMTLAESRDPFVRGAAPTLATGKKWKPAATVAEAKAALRHRDIVGHVQHGRGGFGLGATTPTWQKATPNERWHLVVEECAAPATLKHILVGCKNSLTQGRYTWHHNQVLRCLAAALEYKRVATNAIPLNAQTTFPQLTSFIREGEKQWINPSPPVSCSLNAARDWEMRIDLSQRLTFPSEITVTNLCPDLVLWSNSCRRVFIVELTVPWEDAIDEAYERKKLRYANLAAEAEERGWDVKLRPVEPTNALVSLRKVTVAMCLQPFSSSSFCSSPRREVTDGWRRVGWGGGVS
ncbi:hypothetical protein SKAU_G00287750 [Synaphobranchus kaupii]|uniref:Reverse transcriptase n=1 Tax=Synaphobranchus kaupii TaxID=118154 RepID=A0A9Q1EYC3_SYNKA|nr:hypothetical protein SKAU_G00287750 [Synaphobranchus kaupii]